MEDPSSPLFDANRKTLPAGVAGTGTIRTQIEPLYSDGALDFNTIKNSPILKPLAEINNGYVNMELLINRALWEYQENKIQIDSMIEVNPKYSETIILSKFQNLLGFVKQIIQAQDIQKENMKRAINEMIKICNSEYGILEEEPIPTKKVSRKDLKEPETEIREEREVQENIEVPPTVETEAYHSDLLDKDLPAPKKKSKKEGYIPILNEESKSDTN